MFNIVPDRGVGCCLWPEGNGVSSGEGGEGGPGPSDKKWDKQSTLSKEGCNMEQEEEGKKSRTWRRGPSAHRISILIGPLSMYWNIIRLSMMLRLMSYLFQDNKSYGVKNHLHSFIHSPRHVGHKYNIIQRFFVRNQQKAGGGELLWKDFFQIGRVRG